MDHPGHQEHGMGNAHPGAHGGHNHGAMIADFRRRFWVSLALTIPILLLSPLIQRLLGLEAALAFTGSSYVLFALSSGVYFYGGWPFLKGLFAELETRKPAMMTLIALAISVAYFYSSAVVFGVQGEVFFWELATLIDVMLLGHWIEMKSVLGASGALEKLVQMMPSEAHLVTPEGMKDVPVANLQPQQPLDKRRQKEDRNRQGQRYPKPPPEISDHGGMAMTSVHSGVVMNGWVRMRMGSRTGDSRMVLLMTRLVHRVCPLHRSRHTWPRVALQCALIKHVILIG